MTFPRGFLTKSGRRLWWCSTHIGVNDAVFGLGQQDSHRCLHRKTRGTLHNLIVMRQDCAQRCVVLFSFTQVVLLLTSCRSAFCGKVCSVPFRQLRQLSDQVKCSVQMRGEDLVDFMATDSIPIVLSETEVCRRQFEKERTCVTCCAVTDDAIELHLNTAKHIATRRIRPRRRRATLLK